MFDNFLLNFFFFNFILLFFLFFFCLVIIDEESDKEEGLNKILFLGENKDSIFVFNPFKLYLLIFVFCLSFKLVRKKIFSFNS